MDSESYDNIRLLNDRLAISFAQTRKRVTLAPHHPRGPNAQLLIKSRATEIVHLTPLEIQHIFVAVWEVDPNASIKLTVVRLDQISLQLPGTLVEFLALLRVLNTRCSLDILDLKNVIFPSDLTLSGADPQYFPSASRYHSDAMIQLQHIVISLHPNHPVFHDKDDLPNEVVRKQLERTRHEMELAVEWTLCLGHFALQRLRQVTLGKNSMNFPGRIGLIRNAGIDLIMEFSEQKDFSFILRDVDVPQNNDHDFTEEHRDDQGYHFIKYRRLVGVAAGR